MFNVKRSILEITPYTPGKSDIDGREDIIKLSSNENSLGCSNKAREAYLSAVNNLHRYPDGASIMLRKELAQLYGVDENLIICGAGSDEIISLLIHSFASEGDEIICCKHGFLMYKIYALAAGVKPVIAEEENYTSNIAHILSQVTNKTKLVFIANPNNPTGSYLTRSELYDLRKNLDENIILVIDAAYAEYVTKENYEDGLSLVKDFDNVVMTRTFSKAYGLASLRVGWCAASAYISDILNRVRSPFNVNLPAQIAAVAALQDQDFIQKSRNHNQKWLDIFHKESLPKGYKILPAVANFFLLETPVGKLEEVHNKFEDAGIIVRNVASYDLPNHLRITIGNDSENQQVLEIVKNL